MQKRISGKASFWLGLVACALSQALFLTSAPAFGYTANKVWFEFRPEGIYRVHVNYTIPELKEARSAFAEFTSKKEAERFYWDLVRGADFHLPDPKQRSFQKEPPLSPEPW